MQGKARFGKGGTHLDALESCPREAEHTEEDTRDQEVLERESAWLRVEPDWGLVRSVWC